MARVAAGDREAFATLYDDLSGLVFTIAARVIVDREQAAEVTQESFLAVWTAAASFDPGRGRVSGWVGAIAHRRAVDAVRAGQARRDREERTALADRPRDHDETSEAVLLQDERRRVRKCMDTLTELERRSVSAAYDEGLSYPEVARREGAGLPAVKSRMRSGLRRLRDCLEVTA